MKITNLNHQKVKLSTLPQGQLFEWDLKLYVKLDGRGQHLNALRGSDLAVVCVPSGDPEVRDLGPNVDIRNGVLQWPKPLRTPVRLGQVMYGHLFESFDGSIYVALNDSSKGSRHCFHLGRQESMVLENSTMVYPVVGELMILKESDGYQCDNHGQ